MVRVADNPFQRLLRKQHRAKKQVYLRGGSQRAFPRSLIRDSDSAEEVRGRGGWAGGDGGGGREQDVQVSGREGTVAEKMDLWGPLNDQHPSLYSERFLGLLGQMGEEGESTLVGLCHFKFIP